MKKIKKIVFIWIILLLFLLSIFVYYLFFKEEIEISYEAVQYLNDLKVTDFNVTYNDKDKIVQKVKQNKAIVTNEEIKKYIDDELLIAGDFIEIKDRDSVKMGDFVELSCTVFVKGRLVNELKQEVLKVGAGYYGKEFEEKLIGVQKNKKTVFEIIVPKNEEEYAGQKEKIEVLVTKIQYKNEQRLTNEYVRKNFEGLNNIHDYYRYVKQTIADEKNLEQQNKIKNNIKKQLATIYNVKIKEEQKALYAKKIYGEYCKMAESMGVTMEEFSNKIYGKSKKQFANQCYEEAIDDLETIILFGVLSKKEKISVKEKDIKSYINNCKNTKDDFDNSSNYYNYVKYRFMEDKVVQLYKY